MRSLKISSPLLFLLPFLLVLLCFSNSVSASNSQSQKQESEKSQKVETGSSSNLPKLKLNLMSSKSEQNELLNLFDLQDQSLENLEIQWNLLQEQLSKLESNNKELEQQLSISSTTITKLQGNLTELQKENKKQREYTEELQGRLKEADRLHRSATVAGVISGVALGTGVSLMVAGGVKKNDAVLYSGLGIAGSAVIVWTLGKICNWW